MPENNTTSKQQPGTNGPTPKLDWLDDTIPVSRQFDDPYYSKNNGLAETEHVFIRANHLPERFAATDNFTIAELGFGTGLNFLAAAIQWQKHVSPAARLNFISFEKYPISSHDMQKALARWPQISEQAEKFVAAYDAALGTAEEKLLIDWSPVCHLCIHLGDAQEQLARAKFHADAWFLDGFAPSKNPDLWSVSLLAEVYGHTAIGGTFATYTAAGWVRRNLQAAGFTVQRVPGHAGKREMMVGSKPGDAI